MGMVGVGNRPDGMPDDNAVEAIAVDVETGEDTTSGEPGEGATGDDAAEPADEESPDSVLDSGKHLSTVRTRQMGRAKRASIRRQVKMLHRNLRSRSTAVNHRVMLKKRMGFRWGRLQSWSP